MKTKIATQDLIYQKNIALSLEDSDLDFIAKQVLDGFELDLDSCTEWRDKHEDYLKLALQIQEKKNFPWPNASNIKFPLLTTAAMQFSARAYPTLVPSDQRIVKAKAVGLPIKEEKMKFVDAISTHMSYQIFNEMQDWEEEQDKNLMLLAIVGTTFKKTYYDEDTKQPCSKLILPSSLVVNYWSSSLERCYRKTEIISITKNEILENVNAGFYLDLDWNNSDPQLLKKERLDLTEAGHLDNSTPYEFLEQHTYLDLDEDGYEEPYVITVDYNLKKVVRIVSRWAKDGITVDAKNKILKIKPLEYFTKYSFIPNPDGGFYDIGFGALLGPINDSINTVINQLIDAGTLANMQGGFISKGLRIKQGETRFSPGEWKSVSTTVDDIKKGLFPLPTKEPSNVLFQLLGQLVQSGKEVASVAEIFVGKMPGQNTPATTTMATIEQGMKVFTAIYKRVYRAMDKEFQKIFTINKLNGTDIAEVLDNPEFDTAYNMVDYKDIVPAADPNAVSISVKAMKADQLIQLLQIAGPDLNKQEVIRRIVEAQEQPDPEKLLNTAPPAPSPEMVKLQIEGQEKQAKLALQKEDQDFSHWRDTMALEIEATKNQLSHIVSVLEAMTNAQTANSRVDAQRNNTGSA